MSIDNQLQRELLPEFSAEACIKMQPSRFLTIGDEDLTADIRPADIPEIDKSYDHIGGLHLPMLGKEITVADIPSGKDVIEATEWPRDYAWVKDVFGLPISRAIDEFRQHPAIQELGKTRFEASGDLRLGLYDLEEGHWPHVDGTLCTAILPLIGPTTEVSNTVPVIPIPVKSDYIHEDATFDEATEGGKLYNAAEKARHWDTMVGSEYLPPGRISVFTGETYHRLPESSERVPRLGIIFRLW